MDILLIFFERFSEILFVFDCTASLDSVAYCLDPAVSNSCFKITVVMFPLNLFYKEHMCIQMDLSMIFQICHRYSILRANCYRSIILSSLKLDSLVDFCTSGTSAWPSGSIYSCTVSVDVLSSTGIILSYNQVGVLIIRVTTQLWLIVGWFGPTVRDGYPLDFFWMFLWKFLLIWLYSLIGFSYLKFESCHEQQLFHKQCYDVWLFVLILFYKLHMCIQMEISVILQICHSYNILRSYRYEYIILYSLKLDSSRL